MDNLRIATFNCQGLNNPDKQTEIFKDAANYNIQILALQETHIKENITIRGKTHTHQLWKKRHTISRHGLYSRQQNRMLI